MLADARAVELKILWADRGRQAHAVPNLSADQTTLTLDLAYDLLYP
jgi:hypothetical protein